MSNSTNQYTRKGVEKSAALLNAALDVYNNASTFKPLVNATRNFAKGGGIDYLKAKTAPLVKKIYKGMGQNNRIRADFVKHKADNIANRAIPAIERTTARINRAIPDKVHNLSKQLKTVEQGFTNVGKI